MRRRAAALMISMILIFCSPLVSAAEQNQSQNNSKIIVVEIKKKVLKLVESGEVLKEYRVRVGKKATPTPLGEGYIFKKRDGAIFRYQDPPNKGKIIRYSALSNGKTIKIDYKKMKALGFRIKGHKTDKYSIHSITDYSTIGKAVSNGCIGMKIEDMLELYSITEKGTKIIIKS